MHHDWLFVVQRCLIDRLLAQPAVRVAIGHWENSTDDIVGFAIADVEARVLYWIFTKKNFRNGRVATRLLEHLFGKPNGPMYAHVILPPLYGLADTWQIEFTPYRLDEVTG